MNLICVGACRACECKCVYVLVEARGQHYMPSQSLSTFCACACVCVHVCTCVWRPEFSIRSLPPSLSMLLFETGSHTEPGARMVTNKLHLAVFGPPPPPPHPVLALHACMATSAFLCGCSHSQRSSLHLSPCFSVCLRLEPGPHTCEADAVALSHISSSLRPSPWHF